MSKSEIGIMDILNSEIPLKDKGWFLIKKCELTIDQKKDLAYDLAMIVLPIYEAKYPGDNSVRECLEAIVLFRSGSITRDELLNKRTAAAAAAAADADAAAAYAAASAAASYYAASYYAAYYAADASYKDQIFAKMIEFVNNIDIVISA